MALKICNSFSDCKESAGSSFFGHRPSLIACAVFMGIAGLCLLVNAIIALRTRKHTGFVVAMALACAVSVSGWAARYVGSRNPWLMWTWMQSTAAISIAPVFISTAIYLVLGALVSVLGEEHSFVKPRVLMATLVTSDVVALALQCAGFGIAFADVHHNTLNVNAETHAGARIVMAAAGLQLLTLLIAMVVVLVVAVRASNARRTTGFSNFHRDAGHASLTGTFYACAGGIIAVMALLAGRLGYRVTLLGGGIRGSLAQDRALFIVFDGITVAVALVVLVALHPALFLASGRTGSVQGREGRFEKLHDAEDVALVPRSHENDPAPSYSDSERPLASVPLQPLVFEPPRSYDPQPQEPNRYEPTRNEVNRRSLTPQPYETGASSMGNSRETSPKPYGSGGI